MESLERLCRWQNLLLIAADRNDDSDSAEGALSANHLGQPAPHPRRGIPQPRLRFHFGGICSPPLRGVRNRPVGRIAPGGVGLLVDT